MPLFSLPCGSPYLYGSGVRFFGLATLGRARAAEANTSAWVAAQPGESMTTNPPTAGRCNGAAATHKDFGLGRVERAPGNVLAFSALGAVKQETVGPTGPPFPFLQVVRIAGLTSLAKNSFNNYGNGGGPCASSISPKF